MWVCCRSTTARVRGEGAEVPIPTTVPIRDPNSRMVPIPSPIPNGGSSPSSETSKDRIPRRNYSATKDCSIRVLLPMPMPMNSSMGSRNCSRGHCCLHRYWWLRETCGSRRPIRRWNNCIDTRPPDHRHPRLRPDYRSVLFCGCIRNCRRESLLRMSRPQACMIRDGCIHPHFGWMMKAWLRSV